MTEIRWLLAAVCGLVFVGSVATSLAVAIRCYRTGQSGSGVWFVGSAVAFAGVLLVPVGTPQQRFPYAWLPLAFELALFAVLRVVDRVLTWKRE